MLHFSLRKRLLKTGLLTGMTDVHAHLLPGVDDGIRTFGEAEEAVRFLNGWAYGVWCLLRMSWRIMPPIRRPR